MSIVARIKRKLVSAYHNQISKTLHTNDGIHSVSYTVPHYSERCGWEKFGAKSEQEYEYWWQEACGIVSLRMIIDALDPTGKNNQTIFSQIQDAIKNGAYLEKQVDGTTIRVGWTHDKLIKLANRRSIKGYSAKLTTLSLCKAIVQNRLVIASIHRPFSRFIDENAPRKKAGGHLVVITGFEWNNGQCTGFFVADPYDTNPREEAVNASLFEDVYSGSAIVFYR